ncbi:MAG: STAS domain-containing protein [Bacteroidota bacterium]
MAYSLETRDDLLMLKVDTLLNELENKYILEKVDEQIHDGFINIVVDLEDLGFLNSMGLNFLISLLTKSRNAGGETVIINIPNQVTNLLVVTKLNEVFVVKETLEDALEIIDRQD